MFAILLFIWIACAITTAIIAGSRDRNAFAWFGIGLVMGIFGLVLVIVLPAAPRPASSAGLPLVGAGRRQDGSKQQCPDCQQEIPISLRQCTHCGYRLA